MHSLSSNVCDERLSLSCRDNYSCLCLFHKLILSSKFSFDTCKSFELRQAKRVISVAVM